MTADDILNTAEKKAREAIEDFTITHHLKPNALMAGREYVSRVVEAVEALTAAGKAAEVDRRLPICPATNQRTIAGLSLIISSRADATLCGVLVGNPEILKAQPTPTR